MDERWEALRQSCLACTGCALAQTRTNVVFGDGATDAEILLIGEGPGQSEDEQGVPFVGRAGQLLDDMLEIIGLDRSKVYIANIVKCRPPQNRDPLAVEQEACIGYLRRQTALFNPRSSCVWAASPPRPSSGRISRSPRSMASGLPGAAYR